VGMIGNLFNKGKSEATKDKDTKKNSNISLGQTRFTIYKRMGTTPYVYVKGVATHKRDVSDNIVYTYEDPSFRLKEDEVQVMDEDIRDLMNKVKLIETDKKEQSKKIIEKIKNLQETLQKVKKAKNKEDLVNPETGKTYNVRDLEVDIKRYNVLKEYIDNYSENGSSISIDADGMKHIFMENVKGVNYPFRWNLNEHIVHTNATIKKKHFKSAQEKIEDRLKRNIQGTHFGQWDLILRTGLVALIILLCVLNFKTFVVNRDMERLNAENALAYCSNVYADYVGTEISSNSKLNEFARDKLMDEFIENEKGKTEAADPSVIDLTKKTILGDE
jgi:hypothetical protein